jgi:hypothetical protein
MSDDYTRWDSVRQTQAYLLDEAPTIARRFRWTSIPSKKLIRSTILASTRSRDISLSTSINSKRKDFFDLPDEFTNSLQPEIKVYKTYIDNDGTEHDYLLPMGEYLGRRVNDDGTEVETTRGVVVKSAEFTRLGGNPAEIDTNIKFNLKLFAQDITTFFVKNETSPVIPYTPQASADFIFESGRYEEIAAGINEREREYQAQVASGTVPPTNAHGVGWVTHRENAWDREERVWNRVEALALSAATVGPNGERRTAWIDLIKIDPGQPLNDGEDDTALVTSENQVRIKVEIGYPTPNTKPINYNGNDWQDWAEAIGNQKEVFYLSLFKHQFDFRGYDGVDLSIDFIASANAKQLSPEADLFSNSKIQNKLTRLRANLRAKEKELKLAGEQETEVTIVTTTCMAGISESIATIEDNIRDINAKNRLRLLNQIYLAPGSSPTHHYSRLFIRQYDKIADASRIKNRQLNPDWRLPNNLQAGAHNLDVSNRSMEAADLSVIDEDFATRNDDAEVEATQGQYEGRMTDHFIFLGDVIDAALELLVSNETIEATSEFNSDTWLTWEINETYDRTYHPPIDYGERADRVSRINDILSTFGGFLGGWVTYKNPNNITQTKWIPIRDIPIALDIFRAWWLNNYVKSGRKTLGIRDFISQLMKFVETDVFRNIPIEFGTNEDSIETPKFIVNSGIAKRGFLSEVYRFALANGANVPKKRVRREVLMSAELGSSTQGSSVLFIEQTNDNPTYNELTATITFGETNKGILKGVTFEREDIPGHAEARLFSDRTSVAGNIALREKYNTKLDLIGTTTLAPGSLFYLDPLPLDLGWSQTERTSFARQLGLGGMYRVVNLTSQLNFDSSGNTWETTVNTKWESFGDGHNGISEVAEEEAVGTCADLERQAREARAADVPEEDEIQWDGSM